MTLRRVSDERLERALEALAEPGRFRLAEARIAAAVPQLERLLARALEEGGWFSQVHEREVRKAALDHDPDERLERVRRLLAEETRIAMMVGVAVGFELARELRPELDEEDRAAGGSGDRPRRDDVWQHDGGGR